MDNNSKNGPIVLEHSLQAFFFDRLNDANKRTTNPLPNEVIFYSSLVMDKFGESANYFAVEDDGSVREKLLGMKLLEAGHKKKNQHSAELKEVGDTALFLCGFFSDSVSRKITDISYYQSVGRTAYNRLNTIIPEVYEIQDFYLQISDLFVRLMNLMAIISSEVAQGQGFEQFLILNSKVKTAK